MSISEDVEEIKKAFDVQDDVLPLPTLVTREEWGARPPQEGIHDLRKPVMTVTLTLDQHHVPPCKTKEDCVRSVRLLQSYYMDDKGLKDIPYNFIIGNDGNMYEGRGWDKKPEKSRSVWNKSCKDDEFRDKIVDIGVLSGFVNEYHKNRVKLEHESIDQAAVFVKDCVKKGLISKDFKLVGFYGIFSY